MKRSRYIGLVVALAMIVSLMPLTALAESPPPPPHTFRGTVTVLNPDDSTTYPAPDGMIVSAWIGEEEMDTSVTQGGSYGLAPDFLDVYGDTGDTISFYVNGVDTGQTSPYIAPGTATVLNLTVTIATGTDIDPPPAPELVSPANASYINTSTPTLDWTDVTDPSGVVYNVQIDDNADLSSPVIDQGELAGSAYTASALSDDITYYWRARAIDGAGNASDWSAIWSFEIDTVAPSVTITPLSPDPTTDNTPTFTGTATDTPSTFIKLVQYRIDGGGWIDATATDGAFDSLTEAYTFTTAELPDGEHIVEVRASDAADNFSSYASDTFNVDATPPVISAVGAGDVTSSGAYIYWTTGEAATTQVVYSTSNAHSGDSYANAAEAREAYGSYSAKDSTLVTGHGAALSSLLDGTPYYYRVISGDALGNETISGEYSFTTLTDNTPPVISDVTVPAAGITTSGAIVLWNTDEESTSQAVYGTASHAGDTYASAAEALAAYTSATAKNSAMVYSHGASINGLAAGTIYYYRVISIDSFGNEAVSGEYSFETLPDTTPPAISGVTSSGETQTSATITWTTDEPATSQVVYSTSNAHSGDSYTDAASARADYGSYSAENASLIFFHSVSLSGLTPDTTYYYRVISTDAAGNTAVSDEYSFTTEADTTPPVISGISATDITPTGAVINWNTNELATSRVEYGTSTAYGSFTTLDPSLIFIHSVALEGLTPDTTYHYRVYSTDEYGNEDYSTDRTFTTLPDTIAPVISDVSETGITTSDAIINWSTDEPGTSRVEYGTTSTTHGSYDSITILDGSLVLVHGAVLSELTPDTEYFYRVISSDTYGNEAVSDEGSFTTLPDETAPAISGITETGITTSDAWILWNTSEPATSRVVYDTSSHDGDTYESAAGVLAAYASASAEYPTLVMSHGIGINSLSPNTTYYYRVLSTDAYGNEAWSAEGSFTTLPDTTAPAISDVTEAGITTSDAWILWNTDEPATSQVEYGTTSTTHGSYTSTTTLDASLVYIHGAVLSGLSPNTTYYYRVISSDASGNEAVSDEGTFTTLPDTTAPAISGVTVTNITDTRAIIYWNTDEAATTQVEYGVTDAYGNTTTLNPALVFLHGVVLNGLLPDTTYHFRVRSSDTYGNEGISVDYTFDTLVDETAPTFSGVTIVSVTQTTAVISWRTNEPATSQMEYGIDTSYGTTSLKNSNLIVNHSVLLVGLINGTTYHFRALSTDAFGNDGVSADYTFTTVADTTPPVITGVTEVNVTSTSAVILWLTNEPSSSQVEYGTSTGVYTHTSHPDPTLVNNHGVTLTALAPDTTYYYRVISADADGNEAVSGEGTFTTVDETPPDVSLVSAVAITGSGAVIVWATDENATTQVVYSTTSHAGDTYDTAADARTAYGTYSAEDGTEMQSHGVVLSGLSSGTTYYYRVISIDASGNVTVSEEYSFTTT